MDGIINELLVDFGDLTLDKLDILDRTELLGVGGELFSVVECDDTEDHIKVLSSYILTVLEAVYINKHESNKIN